ncbi:a-macroglobulin complement component [Stylonychia lemnae]|uniref:A-macroglobulin complement component n=1 Tax=Stylonychia lemnae TaxID=5949 RepID=A0A078ACH9_STYLE|nr:a-macroglobulin complement component [Stylonychia lemnae]|eukprot:CDW78538.1 a-macroglobulin complement component [Stylonychia lemnae]
MIYKPNDVMFIEIHLVDAMTKQIMSDLNSQYDLGDFQYVAQFKIMDDQDQEIYRYESNTGRNGTIVYTYKIPSQQNGGEYTISITSHLFPDTKRKFRIRSYTSQEYFTTVDFSKESYTPSDQVLAKIKVKRADGTKLKPDLIVNYLSQMSNVRLDERGETLIQFNIPSDTRQDLLSLVVEVSTPDSQPENSVHSVTIVQFKDLQMKFYPETGHLVADIPNKVYFESLADYEGSDVAEFISGELLITDLNAKEELVLSDIKPTHIGRGSFTFTPKELTGGSAYMFKAKWNRASNGQRYLMSNVDISKNLLFRVQDAVINPKVKDQIELEILANQKAVIGQKLMIKLQLKDKVIYNETLILSSHLQKFLIPLSNLSNNLKNGGIVQITLSSFNQLSEDTLINQQEVLIGERLIFILPSETLNLDIKLDRSEYAPGDQVSVEVDLKNHQQLENDTVFYSMIPSLPSMVYLENEVYQKFGKNEFWYSYDYLDAVFNDLQYDSISHQNLDILLGIQGWRRYLFSEQEFKSLKDRIMNLDDKNEEKQRFEKLIAEKQSHKIMYKNMRGGGIKNTMFKVQRYDEVFDAQPMAVEMAMGAPNDIELLDNKPNIKQAANNILNEEETYDFMKGISTNSRLYTHLKRENWTQQSARIDMTQTLKFTSALEFNPKNKLQTFEINDQISTFRVTVSAFSKQANNFNSTLQVELTIQDSSKAEGQSSILDIQPYSQTQKNYLLSANYSNVQNIVLKVQVSAKDQNGQIYSDSLTRQTVVLPNGFKQKQSQSGLIGMSSSQTVEPMLKFQFQLPKTFVPGTLKVSTAKVFAEPLDNILSAVESLIQDPYGCFEQCSSVTYPIVMALQFLQKAEVNARSDAQKTKIQEMMLNAQQKLDVGYKKLLSYESTQGGYEWFGNNPAHEALTAYGLMQFNEMKKVMPGTVNDEMLTRVQSWLIGRRDGAGGYHLSQQALDTFGRAPVNITSAYLTWVLSGLGYKKLDLELRSLLNQTHFTDDSYFLALVSGAAFNLKRLSEAIELSKRIVQAQNMTSGAVLNSQTSITSSYGSSLVLETTALSLMNWLNQDRRLFAPNIEKAVKFIISSIEDGGRMGSTQSTILCLKALILYMEQYSGIKGNGLFSFYFDGELKDFITFSENSNSTQSAFDFKDLLEKQLQLIEFDDKAHEVIIKIENYTTNNDIQRQDFSLSYTFQIDYLDAHPPTALNPKIEFYLNLKQSQNSLQNIQTNFQQIQIINTQKDSLGMVVAIISVPSCMRLDFNQFELLKQKKRFDSFEISSDMSQYTLYWTGIKPFNHQTGEGKIELDILLVRQYQAIKCQQRASVAYLYYDIENKIWI